VIEPKNSDAYANRALAHRHLGQAREGLADIEKALEIRRDDIALLRSRGMLLWDLGDYRAAMADYNRILDRRADLATLRARGLLHFALADWERAEADLSSLLTGAKSRNEHYPELFRLLARRRAKKDEQRDAFLETVVNWPKGWAKSIGDYLLGDLSEMRLLAESNLGKTPSPNERRCEAYFYIGQTHLLAGDDTAAAEYFEKCVRTSVFHYFEYNLARAELSRLRKEQ
jgi:lipoprotein NlpI